MMLTATLRLAGIAGVVTLAACDTPNPPVYSSGDFFAATAEAVRLNGRPEATLGELPVSGSTAYDGFVTGRLAGDGDGDVVGAMRMNVGFGASNAISGRISDITVLNSFDLVDQTLGGALDITGTRAGAALVATAAGRVVAVDESGVAGGYNMNLAMEGRLRSDVSGADSVSGTVTGSGLGTGWAGGETITLQNGRFYGQR